MSKRPKMHVAMLGLAVASTAAFLAACGSNEPTPSAGATTKSAELAVLDANDPESVARLAKEFDVEIQPFTPPSLDRGAGSEMAFLLYPVGEVRKEGLSTYRIDVDAETYKNDGTLEFRLGGKVLWKDVGPFNPIHTDTVSNIPKEVVDAVKTGELVTWGLFFEGKTKPVTAQFKVVVKTQLTEKLAKMASERRFTKQPKLLQDLVKAQTLQDFGYHSEALRAFLDLAAANRDLEVAHKGIVTNLLRLGNRDIKDSELFKREYAKLPPEKSPAAPARPSFGPGSELAGPSLKPPSDAPYRPAPQPATDPLHPFTPPPVRTDPGNTPEPTPPVTSTPDPGADVPGPGGVITSPPSADMLRAAQQQAKDRRAEADRLAALADAAKAAADKAKDAADESKRDLREAQKFAQNHPGDPTVKEKLQQANEDAQRAAADLQAALEAAAAAAQAAQQAAENAKNAEATALRLQHGGTGPQTPPGGPVQPADMPSPVVAGGTAETHQQVQDALKRAQDAAGRAAGLIASLTGGGRALADALQAADAADKREAAARTALEAHLGNVALERALQAAIKASEKAHAALDEARATAGAQAAGLEAAMAALQAAQQAAQDAQNAAHGGGPDALRIAQEAARRAEEAAARVERLLAGK